MGHGEAIVFGTEIFMIHGLENHFDDIYEATVCVNGYKKGQMPYDTWVTFLWMIIFF